LTIKNMPKTLEFLFDSDLRLKVINMGYIFDVLGYLKPHQKYYLSFYIHIIKIIIEYFTYWVINAYDNCLVLNQNFSFTYR